MNLFEISPTIRWTPSSNEVRSVATIKTDKHDYELVIHCNKSTADHIIGWLDKVVKDKDKFDSGRSVELTNKQNRQSLAGVEDVFDKVVDAANDKASSMKLEYLYMFSTTQRRKETYEKLTKKMAKKLGWSVYQDRNYFLIYNPTLKVKQPDWLLLWCPVQI